MVETPNCDGCGKPILPDDKVYKDPKGRLFHYDPCSEQHPSGRAITRGLNWTPSYRSGPTAQGGLPDQNRRRH